MSHREDMYPDACFLNTDSGDRDVVLLKDNLNVNTTKAAEARFVEPGMLCTYM